MVTHFNSQQYMDFKFDHTIFGLTISFVWKDLYDADLHPQTQMKLLQSSKLKNDSFVEDNDIRKTYTGTYIQKAHLQNRGNNWNINKFVGTEILDLEEVSRSMT